MIIHKPSITFKDLFYWLLLITLAIVLFKQCTKKPLSIAMTNETEKKAIIENAQRVLEKTTDSLTKVIAKRDDKVDSLQGEADVYRYERNESWKKIKEQDNTIKSLSSQVLNENGNDSVHCVELAKQSQFQSEKIREQETLTVKLLDDLHLLSATKDSVISDERRIKDAALKQGLNTAKAYSELFAKFKNIQPKASVWIGPEMQLSPSYQTIGGQIMYATKNGTGWQFGGGMTTNASYYARVGVIFKISFRK